MMRILPALGEILSGGVLRREMVVISENATSDMDCLPRRYQWKIQGEGGAFARAALHADVARVFLDDAVGDRKPKTGAATLAFRRSRLGREEWIVDAVDVFLRNARACVGDAHADKFAVECGHVQDSAPGHGVLGVQEQIQKHLLQSPGV